MNKIEKPFLFRLSALEKILFAKHLSIMIRSGVSLRDALIILKKQAHSRSLQYILERLLEDIQNGQFLSVGLAKFTGVFDDLFINVIKIGEMSGTLTENLDYLSENIKKTQALKRKVFSALIYPLFLLATAIGIVFVIIVFVFPKILPFFKSLNVKLPFITEVFIGFSQLFLNYGVWILFSVATLSALGLMLLRIPKVRYQLHRLLLRLPLIYPLLQKTEMVEFCRTFGVLMKNGIEIITALRLTAGSMSNLVYRQTLLNAIEHMRSGKSLHKYLERHERLFPFTVAKMIEIGETTGTLETNLFYLAELYDTELDDALTSFTALLEPILLLGMGLIVGFIAIAIITPLYEITKEIK